jgi:asparagine synthase (glutamine-hydrolysing)
MANNPSPRRFVRWLRRRRAEHSLSDVARRVRARNLTYLSPERLRVLEECAAEVNRGQVPGDFIECGVALGGSAVLLSEAMGPARAFHGYDVFGMIPPPGESDPPEVHERYAVIVAGRSDGIGGATYYGYRDDLLDQVSATLAEFGHPVGERVQLHPGLFEETLRPPGAVALAHVDCDWHDPVLTCLERLAPRLSPGGRLVLDDYFDYGGCRGAVDEFLCSQPLYELERLGSSVAVRHAAAATSPSSPTRQ